MSAGFSALLECLRPWSTSLSRSPNLDPAKDVHLRYLYSNAMLIPAFVTPGMIRLTIHRMLAEDNVSFKQQ
jgi:hypothetical protein